MLGGTCNCPLTKIEISDVENGVLAKANDVFVPLTAPDSFSLKTISFDVFSVTCPEVDPETIDIPVLATRYEVPSDNCVSDPERPDRNVPLLEKSPI